jgi:hypothetical protein
MADLTQVDDGVAQPQGNTDPPPVSTNPLQDNPQGATILAEDPITETDIPHFKKAEELIRQDISPQSVEETREMRRQLAKSLQFVALKNSQFDDRLKKCDTLNKWLNYLASEYRSKGKAQLNPTAVDPDSRKRLNMGATPFVPTQPSGVYKDSAGDYVL